MARKKKEQPTDPDRPKGYEVLIGYVRKFEYANPEAYEQMNNHPLEGRCYRLIKDKNGYRIHIGAHNTNTNLEGIIIGDKLKDKKHHFSFHIEVVTPANYLDLGLCQEDTLKVVEWISTDNKDLWDNIRKEIAGEESIIQQLQAVLDFKQELEQKQIEAKQEESVQNTDEVSIQTPDIAAATILAESLNTISTKEPEAFLALLDVIEYIASTYTDKYENSGMPNVTKPLLVSSTVGSNMNMYAVMKYAQRYITMGHAKSYNKKDILKLIHYGLFELQRRKQQDQTNG